MAAPAIATALEARLTSLEAAVASLAARLDAIEGKRRPREGPRDEDDRRVVAALAESIARVSNAAANGRQPAPLAAVRFTTKAVRDHARLDADLRGALVAADATGTRSLGRLLSRCAGRTIAGVVVERVHVGRVSVWRLESVSSVCVPLAGAVRE